jgi:type IV pilus assembly protein PilQ
MLDAVGNELILALYLSKESTVAKKSKASSSRKTSKASNKGVSKTASKSASKTSSKTASKTTTKSGTGTKPTPTSLTLAKSASDRALAERGRSVSLPGAGDTGGTQRAGTSGTRATDEIVRKEYLGKPISLDLLDADLKNVLRLLSDISGTNMLVEPDVSGRVTIKVEKVPWDQVLDMILAMNDLGKEQVGNVIRIARQGKLKQEWNQQVEGIKAKQELLEAAKDVGAITTAYLTINYAQPVEIAAKISEIKSAKGKVSVDDRSSLVIYTDYPGRIEAAKGLLARLDRATAQVLIEARIVTANRDLTTSLGTDWSLRFQKRNLPLLTDTPAEGTRTYQVNQPTQPLLGITIADVIGDTLYSLDFKLSALETSSQINIVAAPKVLTINNVKAVISQGTQIPYLVRSDYGSSSTQFKDAVIELQVTPHITPDQKVRLEIQAKQDEPTAKNYQVGDSSVPGIDTRKINTELLVDDGKVIVIGGVMRGREEESTTGTPALNRIPILGWLFKTETTSNTKTELLIFISPQIVESTGMPSRT